MRFEFALTVDALILTLALEFCSRGIFLTWTAFDAHRAESKRFHRPTKRPELLDERFRRAEGR